MDLQAKLTTTHRFIVSNQHRWKLTAYLWALLKRIISSYWFVFSNKN